MMNKNPNGYVGTGSIYCGSHTSDTQNDRTELRHQLLAFILLSIEQASLNPSMNLLVSFVAMSLLILLLHYPDVKPTYGSIGIHLLVLHKIWHTCSWRFYTLAFCAFSLDWPLNKQDFASMKYSWIYPAGCVSCCFITSICTTFLLEKMG